MVGLLHVPLFDSDWIICGSFHILLSSSIIIVVSGYAKTLEGKASL
ncbi:unnamed protein product [Linum tenue]|uniref:Uncharacterized protein n=1 Tax=Linum tenue TaxID=586396 RepID=A0AAV0MZ22_9ROSI|nr:unnamed protein product [Linum tenue]